MGLVWGILYAVPEDGSLSMDQYVRNDSFVGAATKKTYKTLSVVLRFLKATTPFVVFIVYFVFFCGLVCFVVVSYPVR